MGTVALSAVASQAICSLPAALIELTQLRQWVLWRSPSKMPLCVRGGNADSSDSSTWSAFVDALAACQRDPGLGLGFVLTDTTGLVCVDMDTHKVSDPEILREHAQIIEWLNSYTERSPNGGTHIWVHANLVPGHRCKWKEHEIEVYNSGRYMTVSGQQINGNAIEERQSYIASLLSQFPEAKTSNAAPIADTPANEPDEAIASRVIASHPHLWTCDPNEQSDRSKVDLQLCKEIAWHSENREQTFRVFMKSPRANTLRLDKTDQDRNKCVNRPPYVRDTIERAFSEFNSITWHAKYLMNGSPLQKSMLAKVKLMIPMIISFRLPPQSKLA